MAKANKDASKKVEESYKEGLTGNFAKAYGSEALREYADSDGDVQLTVSDDIAEEFASLVKDWRKCQLCSLAATRKHVVFARGTLPADVLFIGEAPGPKEDEVGFPFVGPSGRLLTTIIDKLRESRNGWSYAITNPIGCVPWAKAQEEGQDPHTFRQPEPIEIEKCFPRFLKILELADPKGIVLLGKVAEKFWTDYGEQITKLLSERLEKSVSYKMYPARHPSYLLRSGGAREGNAHYRDTISGLKQFLFQTLNVGER